MIKKYISIFITLSIIVISFPFTAFAEVVSSPISPNVPRYDYRVDSLSVNTSPVRENSNCNITVTFGYTAQSHTGYVPEQWGYVTCGSCSGAGKWNCGSCGGTGKQGGWTSVTCHAGNKCQPSCNLIDWYCTRCGTYNVTGGECGCPSGHGYYQVWRDPCLCTAARKEWRTHTCNSCGGSGKKTCPTCGGSGQVYVKTADAYSYNIPPNPVAGLAEYLVGDKVVHQEYIKLQPNSTYTRTLDINVGEVTGDKEITARINWTNKQYEQNSNNNSKSQTENILACTNFQIEMIKPNASYRENTDVITSFIIKNQDAGGLKNITPTHHLNAEFKAVNPTTNQIVYSKKISDVVIPKQGTNLVYYKWRVPSDYNKSTVDLKLEITSNVAETDYTDNIYTGHNTIQSDAISETPNTQLELKPPVIFNKHTPVPHNTADNFTSVGWSEWVWVNNWYEQKTYTASADATVKITLSEHIGYHNTVKIDSKDVFETRSGYSFKSVVTASKMSNGLDTMTTDIQYCNALFREFNYQNVYGKSRTLQNTIKNKQFEFFINPNSTFGERSHFTPIWTPNGKYEVAFVVSDYWSPVGMLSNITTDYININGSMYDDWNTVKG